MTVYEKQELDNAFEALCEIVVGQRIVRAEFIEHSNYGGLVELELEDGRTVELEGYGDCCAGADVILRDVLASDHVITSAKSVGGNTQEWFLYSDKVPNKAVITLGAEAYEGSGYYGFGITVTVRVKDNV